MKYILRAILAFFGVLAIFYILGCFAQASFDIRQWTEDARFFVSFLGGLFGFVAIISVFVTQEED